MSLQTQAEAHAGPHSIYRGDKGGWLITYDYWTCDNTDALNRANMKEAGDRLYTVALGLGLSPTEAFAVERSGVNVSGQLVRLLVCPDYPELVEAAEAIQKELEDYPALNEGLWSECEWDDAAAFWADALSKQERLYELRESFHNFDRQDFRTLRAAMNGDAVAAAQCLGEHYNELAN